MTASENQTETVIRKLHGSLIRLVVSTVRRGFCLIGQGVLFIHPCLLATDLVDELAMRSGSDPGGRVLRNSPLGPGKQRGSKSLLHSFLGPIEGTGNSNQRRDDAAVLLTKNRFCNGPCVRIHSRFGRSSTGRISMQPSPPLHIVGIRLPHSIASSRSRHSRM